ncbi:hypothetical protein Tco_1453793 [Tanacetum coccineum]
MTLTSTTDKPSKTFDELMSIPIDFSAYIMNGLNITNLTQETLLGPTFKILKGTRTNFAELEYDFVECNKDLLEKLNLNNPEGGDYPFDLTKPLPLVMNGNRQIVPVDYFFNNNLKKQCKTFYTHARGLESSHDVYSTKRILEVTRVEVMQKHGHGYLREIENRLTNLSSDDVSDFSIALRMFTRSMRRWSSLEKKRAHIMIKAIDKQLKERRMMRSLEKFIGRRHYKTDLRLL